MYNKPNVVRKYNQPRGVYNQKPATNNNTPKFQQPEPKMDYDSQNVIEVTIPAWEDATNINPLPVEEWNPAWDAEIEAEKTNPSLLKRISDAIPTPVKAAAAGTVLAATRLLSPESAEARPVPPNWTPQQVADAQNRLNFDSNIFPTQLRYSTPEERALHIKNNIMRGEGVSIMTRLEFLLGECGGISDKMSNTHVTRNDGEWVNWWVNNAAESGWEGRLVRGRTPSRTERRSFIIKSENGTVTKQDLGFEQL